MYKSYEELTDEQKKIIRKMYTTTEDRNESDRDRPKEEDVIDYYDDNVDTFTLLYQPAEKSEENEYLHTLFYTYGGDQEKFLRYLENESFHQNRECQKEEIFRVYSPDKTTEIIDYESNVISKLIELGLDLENSNWIDFIDENGLEIEKYPYYIQTSDEVISIRRSDNTIGTRALMVEGMLRHTAKQLEELRSAGVLTLQKLAKIEKWTGDNSKLGS